MRQPPGRFSCSFLWDSLPSLVAPSSSALPIVLNLKKPTPGVGEMDQQLKTHVVLVENLGLLPSTHVAAKNICNSDSRGPHTFCGFCGYCTHTVHLYTCTQNTHMQKLCRFKTPKSYALPVGGSASPQASASFLLINGSDCFARGFVRDHMKSLCGGCFDTCKKYVQMLIFILVTILYCCPFFFTCSPHT